MRICVTGRYGRGGHRGWEANRASIGEHVFWKGMNSDIATFCNTCLYCRSTIGGKRSPQPIGCALHADMPNEFLHFDLLFMGKSDTAEIYVRILKDDAPEFVMLEACVTEDAEAAVTIQIKWFSLFGVVLMWNSDRVSHFEEKVMTKINPHLHSHHHFTTPTVQIPTVPWKQYIGKSCEPVLPSFTNST